MSEPFVISLLEDAPPAETPVVRDDDGVPLADTLEEARALFVADELGLNCEVHVVQPISARLLRQAWRSIGDTVEQMPFNTEWTLQRQQMDEVAVLWAVVDRLLRNVQIEIIG